ncbi:MAG: coenzyme F420 biosynthesis-associated protein, partial [Frankiales bacterium]
VLGQYEAFTAEGTPGRLILVAPNIVETERRLAVDPHDFRLWVALHEVTHRTQFTAVPWMHDHVRSEIGALLEATSLDDPSELVERLKAIAGNLPRGGSLIEVLQTPEQKAVLDRVTAFMSLLEGHAEHVMDGVGPGVVPSVAEIRRRFDQRRKEHGGVLDRVLRKLLGMDLKALQYAEGKAFVDTAVRELGMAGFNRVWESPATLPTREEIRQPMDWVRRISGTPALTA